MCGVGGRPQQGGEIRPRTTPTGQSGLKTGGIGTLSQRRRAERTSPTRMACKVSRSGSGTGSDVSTRRWDPASYLESTSDAGSHRLLFWAITLQDKTRCTSRRIYLTTSSRSPEITFYQTSTKIACISRSYISLQFIIKLFLVFVCQSPYPSGLAIAMTETRQTCTGI
jgi:hypothetical protein